MSNKEILHKVLLGMDAYLSTGVPQVYWDLGCALTLECYGEAGVKLLEKSHHTYARKLTYDDEKVLHSIAGWDTPNDYVGPEELIAKLEAL